MTEADYLCYLAKNICLGTYQKGGFVVLSRLVSDPKSIYFPDLNYSSEFWQAIKKSKADNLAAVFPKKAVEEVVLKLAQNRASNLIEKDGHKLEVLETEYGTVGSYFATKDRILITNRLGNSKIDFEKTLVLARLKVKNKDTATVGTINWHKRQAVMEYFYGKQKSKLSEKEIKESREYLEKLGFGEEGWVNKVDFKVFSKQEENLLKYLIEINGEVVTFDKTAQILWGEKSYDKYSPQAMAKVVENIRHKIRDQEINREIIFTKRGKGYCIIN